MAVLDGPAVHRIRLAGLDEVETGELARSLAGAAVHSDDVRRLHVRTGGNPLFIGETVRAIVDEGAITSDGRLAIGGAAHLPVTLRRCWQPDRRPVGGGSDPAPHRLRDRR